MKKYRKFLTSVLSLAICASMIMPSGTGLYADLLGNENSIGSEITDTNESYIGKDITQGKHTEYQNGATGENEVNVHVTVTSAFEVVIPKTVILSGETKTGKYTVKVKGDIPGSTRVHVVPDSSFLLSQTEKDDVTATVVQDKTEWGIQNLTTDAVGTISALDVTSGVWNGTFNFNINFDGTPAAHTHSYTEEVTKQATCGEAGSKKLTCSCGDVKTEEIPATGNHNYVDGVCSECGGKEPCTNHVDEDNNHLCDNCNEKISECADVNHDHNCDVCGSKLSDHADENKDHNCDVCGVKVSEHVDEDGDGNCDECGDKVQLLVYLRKQTFSDVENCEDSDFLGSSNVNSNLIRKNIEKVYFDTFDSVDGQHFISDSNAWDVSANQDGSIIGYVGSDGYSIHIAPTHEDTRIALTGSIKGLFSCMNTKDGSYELILVGFDSVDTSNVTDMSYLFYNTPVINDNNYTFSLNVNTKNVTNIENMFAIKRVSVRDRYYISIGFGDKVDFSNVVNSNNLFYRNVLISKSFLKNMDLNGLTIIGNEAFKGIGSATIVIPNSVKEIGHSAFFSASADTKYITIPDSVEIIGVNAFSGVTHIYYNGTATGSPWGAKTVN